MKIGPWVFLGLALLLPWPSLAADTTDEWRQSVKEVDQKLRARDWAAAEKQARQLAVQTADRTGMGKATAHGLAVVTALRAIAEAGLGQNHDAAWHWDMALNLDPEIAKTDLSLYGSAADWLRNRKLRALEPPLPPDGLRMADGSGVVKKDVQRPKLVSHKNPELPAMLRNRTVVGLVVVQAVISTDGRPRDPRVETAPTGVPAMAYAALEALRQWRFEPARVEGKPVEVYYTLTVDYHVTR